MARSLSIVSYWPWHTFSFSWDPSMHFRSTRPTRKMTLTPKHQTKTKVSRCAVCQAISNTMCYQLQPLSKTWYKYRGVDCVRNKFGVCTGLREKPTFAEEHVPNAQHRCPWQRAREGTHEPLRHVEHRIDLVLLQVAVSDGRHALQ